MAFAVHVRNAPGTLGRLIGVHPGDDRRAAELDIERHRQDLGLVGLDFALLRVGPLQAEQLRQGLASAVSAVS